MYAKNIHMKDFVLFYEVIEIATVEIIDKRLQAMFKNETKSFLWLSGKFDIWKK